MHHVTCRSMHVFECVTHRQTPLLVYQKTHASTRSKGNIPQRGVPNLLYSMQTHQRHSAPKEHITRSTKLRSCFGHATSQACISFQNAQAVSFHLWRRYLQNTNSHASSHACNWMCCILQIHFQDQWKEATIPCLSLVWTRCPLFGVSEKSWALNKMAQLSKHVCRFAIRFGGIAPRFSFHAIGLIQSQS